MILCIDGNIVSNLCEPVQCKSTLTVEFYLHPAL